MKKLNFKRKGIYISLLLLATISCSKEELEISREEAGSSPELKAASASVNFSTSSAGANTAMNYWVVGTHRAQTSIDKLGNQIDAIRVGGFQKWPLNNDNTLSTEAKQHLDNEIKEAVKILSVNPNATIALCSSGKKGKVHSSFVNNGNIRPTKWVALFKAVRSYLLEQFAAKGYSTSIAYIEVNNEPDWKKYGDKSNMNTIMAKMQKDAVLGSIPQVGPSTLNCANANKWWKVMNGNADWGATHVLGGNMNNYISFIKKVNQQGKPFFNSEAHTVAEMIVAAEYGSKGGLWWYPVSEMEADFTHAQFENRICYKEVRGNWAVAAGYRGEGNTVHLFVSSAGRFGNANISTTFTFNCSDRSVRFDGSELKSSHTVTIGKNDTRHIVVTW